MRRHNTHADSPKKDWKEGDVPGVLEVIRPLDGDEQCAREGLRSTVIFMVGLSGRCWACGLILVLTNQRRYVPKVETGAAG